MEAEIVSKSKGPETREQLFTEMIAQNTYTDIVDFVLRFLKKMKGTPADLVALLEHLNTKLKELRTTINPEEHQLELSQVSGNSSPANRQGSKIIKLVLGFLDGNADMMCVEFHLKMLYSVHKNKKAPAYMLKSILVSLNKLPFERLQFRERAFEMLKILKPNCY